MLPRSLSPAWSITAPIWAATRLTVIMVGFFAVLLIGSPQPNEDLRASDDPLANLPARWDAWWYLDIAANGYRFGTLVECIVTSTPFRMRAGP